MIQSLFRVKRKNIILLLLVPALLLLSGCTQNTEEQETEDTTISETPQQSSATVTPSAKTTLSPTPEVTPMSTAESFARKSYEYSATLEDVSGGTATGKAQAGFEDQTYTLYVTFKSLKDPEPGFFYEGWVVRSNPLSVISTGKVEKNDGRYVNTYLVPEDLTDHSQYVLTIEPDDNDPAPAGHVLEGTFHKQ